MCKDPNYAEKFTKVAEFFFNKLNSMEFVEFVYSKSGCGRMLCSQHVPSFFPTSPSTPNPFIFMSSLLCSHHVISSIPTDPSTPSLFISMSSLLCSYHMITSIPTDPSTSSPFRYMSSLFSHLVSSSIPAVLSTPTPLRSMSSHLCPYHVIID